MADPTVVTVVVFLAFLIVVVVIVKDDNDLALEAIKGLSKAVAQVLTHLVR